MKIVDTSRYFVLSAVAGLIMLGIFIWWSNQPVLTTPQKLENNVRGSSTDIANEIYENENFKTKIPSDYKIKSDIKNTSSNVLSQTYLSNSYGRFSTNQSGEIAITIGILPPEGLADLSSVKLRQSHAEQYIRNDELLEFKATKIIFIKSAPNYEIAVYASSGNKYLSLAVSSGTSRSAEVKSLAQNILSNWEWKN